MIGIDLPNDFTKRKSISDIFDKIAKKIFGSDDIKNVYFMYQGKKRQFKTRDSVKNFLVARDFYEYDFINITQEVFKYNKLSNYRKELLKELSVKVCPYCNVHFIGGFVDNNGQEKEVADIDHFYPKSQYPEYGLCLYNFIPACQICNQRIKGTKKMTPKTHIYPYDESFEGNSNFKINNLVKHILQNEDVEITLTNPNENERVANSIERFKLKQRYQNFSQEASELVERVQMYNEVYSDSLISDFENLDINKKQMTELIFGRKVSVAEYGQIPLGKFKEDILKQLGVR